MSSRAPWTAGFWCFPGTARRATISIGFLAPTLLGNTLGGVALVALLNHAPLVTELRPDAEAGAVSR